MSIKKITSIELWRKRNAHDIVRGIKANYTPRRYDQDYQKKLEQNEHLFPWLDQSANHAEERFQQWLAQSELEPICNPYGWNNEFRQVWRKNFWNPITKPEWRDFEDVWIFKGDVFIAEKEHARERGLYSEEDIGLLILELYDKGRRRLEKLKQLYSPFPDEQSSGQRPRIPERIRIEVWRRDGGKCARCGSRKNLEFDHIVPISKSGSNTARNIELLCERCNREKSGNVA